MSFRGPLNGSRITASAIYYRKSREKISLAARGRNIPCVPHEQNPLSIATSYLAKETQLKRSVSSDLAMYEKSARALLLLPLGRQFVVSTPTRFHGVGNLLSCPSLPSHFFIASLELINICLVGGLSFVFGFQLTNARSSKIRCRNARLMKAKSEKNRTRSVELWFPHLKKSCCR